jgi:hypothetical protein
VIVSWWADLLHHPERWSAPGRDVDLDDVDSDDRTDERTPPLTIRRLLERAVA